MQFSLNGLYAITDSHLIRNSQLISTVEQAIMGGACIIQYRDKTTKLALRIQQAQAINQLCKRFQIPFIINDDIELAQQVGANGVHLGKNDTKLAIARQKLGKQAIIGVSCYNQITLAQQAINGGANYVAFGRFFASQTKAEAVSCSIATLHQARKILACPIVAIGGITPNNGKVLLEAGANSLAVIQGVFGQKNVRYAAQKYSCLFDKE